MEAVLFTMGSRGDPQLAAAIDQDEETARQVVQRLKEI